MKWIHCRICKAEWPVADTDTLEDWEDPCEYCGSQEFYVSYENQPKDEPEEA